MEKNSDTGEHRNSNTETPTKETPTQVFFCEYCEKFQNTYFEELLQVATSVGLGKHIWIYTLQGFRYIK